MTSSGSGLYSGEPHTRKLRTERSALDISSHRRGVVDDTRATRRAATRAGAGRTSQKFRRATPKFNLRLWCEQNGEWGRRVLEEWDDENRSSEDVTRGSAYRARWVCRVCSHEWTAAVGPRTRKTRPTGCPGCAGKTPTLSNNLFSFCAKESHGGRFDHLRWEWNHPTNNMEEYTPASHRIVPWKCRECSHEWRAKINNRTDLKNPTNCRKCNPGGGAKTQDHGATTTQKKTLRGGVGDATVS